MWNKKNNKEIAKKALRSLAGGSLLAMTAACGPDPMDGYFGAQEAVELFSVTDVSRREGQGKVDLVLVIDNSGSMKNDQEALSKNLGLFAELLPNLDICYAITTTDAWRKADNAISKDRKQCRNPQDSNAMSGAAFIEEFKKDVLVGIRGSGSERMGESIYQWLRQNEGFDANTGEHTPNYKESILRPNALWVLAVISDEAFQIPRNNVKVDGKLVDRAHFGPEGIVGMFKAYQEKLNKGTNESAKFHLTAIYDERQDGRSYQVSKKKKKAIEKKKRQLQKRQRYYARALQKSKNQVRRLTNKLTNLRKTMKAKIIRKKSRYARKKLRNRFRAQIRRVSVQLRRARSAVRRNHRMIAYTNRQIQSLNRQLLGSGRISGGYGQLVAAAKDAVKFDLRRGDFSQIVNQGLVQVVEEKVSISSQFATEHPARPNQLTLTVVDQNHREVLKVPAGAFHFNTETDRTSISIDQDWVRGLIQANPETAETWYFRVSYYPIDFT